MIVPTQSLWHTTPLFYVPHLLHTGAIFSAAELLRRGLPVRPRPTAIHRKTKLGLADYVHLSPNSKTPLLADKQAKGYPHVLLRFDRDAVLELPGVALLRYNTKRWAHRDDFVPVTNTDEQAKIWAEHERGKYPSLEILVPKCLALSDFQYALITPTLDEAALLQDVITALNLAMPTISASPLVFPVPNASPNHDAIRAYFAECKSAGRVLDPPALAFD